MSELKVGDKVYGYRWGGFEVKTVKRITAKTVFFEGGYPRSADSDLYCSWCQFYRTPEEAVVAHIVNKQSAIAEAESSVEKAREALAKFKEDKHD